MANKTISELQLRDNVGDGVNVPVDDGVQSYRTTALQWFNYMVTKFIGATGDLIYAASTTTVGKLAIGTTGQVLSVVGGLPSWQNLPGKYHLAAYYVASSSNYWSRAASGSYGDFSITGSIPNLTTVKNSNFGTLSKATSDLPGISFSAPRTGTIKCTVRPVVLPTQSNSASTWSMKLVESVTGTDVGFVSGATTNNGTNNLCFPSVIVGYFDATISTTYNFKLQVSHGVGTLYIGASAFETMLGFEFEYVS